ncbi:MAG: SpoIIE family protein phosphatase [Armatimonadota bacterium]
MANLKNLPFLYHSCIITKIMHIQRILKIALEKERKAYRAYMKASGIAIDPVDKTLFKNLALEEKKHEKILKYQIKLANQFQNDKDIKIKLDTKMGDVKLKAARELAEVYFQANKELQKINLKLSEEEKTAALIQRNLIPRECPLIDGLEIRAVSHMARKIGGDFFDFWEDDKGLSLVIADIMGKGLPASLLMTSLRATWKSFVSLGYKPHKIVSLINNLTYNDFNVNQSFSTLIAAHYEYKNSRIHFCNAGNEPPLYFNYRTKKVSFLRSMEILIGVDRSFKYKGRNLKLNLGDIVIFFTDGLPEYLKLKDLKKIVLQNFERSAKNILDLIIDKPMENLKDDTSVIIFKKIPKKITYV